MKYLHLAQRFFNTPLLITRSKAEEIRSFLVRRMAGHDDDPEPGQGRKRKPFQVTSDGIAVIEIIGPLVKRDTGEFISGGPTTYVQIENEFMDAATDPAVKGILLLVDSPGGESVGAFELSDMIHSQRSSKPIVAAVDGDGFSAAYALASSASKIYVTKSGGVGSVGVWMQHIDFSEWEAKEGIKITYLFAGARKIDGNPDMPLSEEARERFQSIVDEVYRMFIKTVARNREMSAADVRATEAKTFSAADGVEIGFADKVGTVADALAELRRMIRSDNTNSRKGARKMEEDITQTVTENAEEQGALTLTVDVRSGEEIRFEALTYAAEVAELCVLAGQGKRAAEFIRAGKVVGEVRQELINARAEHEDGPTIHSQVLPDSGANAGPRNPKDSPVVKAVEKMFVN